MENDWFPLREFLCCPSDFQEVEFAHHHRSAAPRPQDDSLGNQLCQMYRTISSSEIKGIFMTAAAIFGFLAILVLLALIGLVGLVIWALAKKRK